MPHMHGAVVAAAAATLYVPDGAGVFENREMKEAFPFPPLLFQSRAVCLIKCSCCAKQRRERKEPVVFVRTPSCVQCVMLFPKQ